MGSFKKGGFSLSRSPDPIDEHMAFVKNVLNRIDAKAFSAPIAECMLDQNFFNGRFDFLLFPFIYDSTLFLLHSIILSYNFFLLSLINSKALVII